MWRDIKSLIKKNKLIYKVTTKSYSRFRSTLQEIDIHIRGTAAQEKLWSRWHLSHPGYNVEANIMQPPFPHRQMLLEIIAKYAPQRILEVGCGFGPNLYLLARQFPDAEITGVDLNPVAVAQGNEFFARQGLKVKLLHLKADELDSFADKSFDLVFTDAVLIYVGPDKICKVAHDMVRLSQRVVIIKEWHTPDTGRSAGRYYAGKWIRDYVSLLKQFTPPEVQFSLTRFSPEIWPDANWSTLGAIIECVM